ncbi:MAG: hypothetical protein ACRD88_12160, partial [Terriglobia bacterium]
HRGSVPSAVNLLVSGWQVNGISTFQSGTPLIVNTVLNNTGIFTPGQRPPRQIQMALKFIW